MHENFPRHIVMAGSIGDQVTPACVWSAHVATWGPSVIATRQARHSLQKDLYGGVWLVDHIDG